MFRGAVQPKACRTSWPDRRLALLGGIALLGLLVLWSSSARVSAGRGFEARLATMVVQQARQEFVIRQLRIENERLRARAPPDARNELTARLQRLSEATALRYATRGINPELHVVPAASEMTEALFRWHLQVSEPVIVQGALEAGLEVKLLSRMVNESSVAAQAVARRDVCCCETAVPQSILDELPEPLWARAGPVAYGLTVPRTLSACSACVEMGVDMPVLVRTAWTRLSIISSIGQ